MGKRVASSRRHMLAAILCLAFGLPMVAVAAGFPGPAPRDLCPVCGMVVSKYPSWVAGVRYADGHAHYFDGAKDLFKYLADPARYARGHRASDIVDIVVTEYYDLKRIDARRAQYVLGSDVHGPMGHELIPFVTRADAEEFMRDHRGARIVTFGEVTPELTERLDRGQIH